MNSNHPDYDIDRAMEDSGYFEDAASPDHSIPCPYGKCHLRGGQRAWCSRCIADVNESGFITVDTLYYIGWWILWALAIFQPWERW